jgi:hypothetical protein
VAQALDQNQYGPGDSPPDLVHGRQQHPYAFAFSEFPHKKDRGFTRKAIAPPELHGSAFLLPARPKGFRVYAVVNDKVRSRASSQAAPLLLQHEPAAGHKGLHRDRSAGSRPFPLAQDFVKVMHVKQNRQSGKAGF